MRNGWLVGLVTLASLLAACGGPDVPKITREVTAQLRADVRKEMERIDRENAALVRFYPKHEALWAVVDTVDLIRDTKAHLVGTVTMHRGGDTTHTGITVVVDGGTWMYRTEGPLGGVVSYTAYRGDIIAQQLQQEALRSAGLTHP